MGSIHSVFTRSLFFAAACCALVMSAQAHEAPSGRIDKITHQIEHTPKDAKLWLKRGRYHLEIYQYSNAEADLKQALVLDGELLASHYFLAETYFYVEDYPAGLTQVNIFIDKKQENLVSSEMLSKAYGLKGDLLFAQGNWFAAGANYQIAARSAEKKTPEYYQLAAQAYMKSRQNSKAIQVVDQGVKAIGPLDVLLQKGYEASIPLDKKRALAYLDTMIGNGKRLPALYLDKAQLLYALNDPAAAKKALMDAQQAFEQWSEAKRASSYAQEIQQGIAKLDSEILY